MSRPRTSRPADARAVFFVLAAMMTAITLLQRLALPVGGLSFALAVVLAGVGYLLLSGALVEDRVRAGLYLLAVAAVLLAAASAFSLGRDGSLSSVLLLVVLYAPFVYVLRREYARLFPRLLEFFCKLMVLAAVLSLSQMGAQLLGWQYTDPFQVLPSQFLLEGYNTSYPLEFGSALWKSNGFVFLEPSFCSQFLALATIVQLARGEKRWRVPLYIAGIVPTVSGTGLLLLAFGLVVLSLRRGPLWSFGMVAFVSVVTVIVAVSPAGDLFAARAAEVRTNESSISLRSVEPYQQTYEELGADDATALIGRGPGFVEREASDHLKRTSLSVAFPVIPKLLSEYGLIAGAVFVLFTLVAFWSRTPSPTIAACILFLHLTLSGSLLQPQTVYLAYLLTSLFAVAPRVPAFRPAEAGRRLVPA